MSNEVATMEAPETAAPKSKAKGKKPAKVISMSDWKSTVDQDKNMPEKQISLVSITTNFKNPRKIVPLLNAEGYGTFTQLPNSNKKTLRELGLSDVEADRQEFCSLIEEKAPHIITNADSIRAEGQLQAVEVRTIPGTDNYDLVFGSGRYLAILYNRCKHGGELTIRAKIHENMSDNTASRRSYHENFARKDMDPIEEAEWIALIRQQVGTDQKALEQATGLGWQTCRQRMILLKLDPEEQTKVRTGIMPVTKAVALVTQRVQEQKGKSGKNGKNGKVTTSSVSNTKTGASKTGTGFRGDNTRRGVPTLKALEVEYNTREECETMTARQWMAEVLGVKFQTLAQLKKLKEEQEKLEKAAAEAKAAKGK